MIVHSKEQKEFWTTNKTVEEIHCNLITTEERRWFT